MLSQVEVIKIGIRRCGYLVEPTGGRVLVLDASGLNEARWGTGGGMTRLPQSVLRHTAPAHADGTRAVVDSEEEEQADDQHCPAPPIPMMPSHAGAVRRPPWMELRAMILHSLRT